jgi:hypothetical protein
MRQQHKHYYYIRAFGDGWNLMQCIHAKKAWFPVDYPNFHPDAAYYVVPDEDGWLPWYGGGCPVAAGTMVDLRYRRGIAEEKAAYAHLSRWKHLPCDDDIVAYRIVEEAKADPYAELKAAAKDPTKQIKYTHPDGTSDGWHDSGYDWQFSGLVHNYEIRNKLKKMKLLAYIDGVSGELLWRLEGHKVSSYWKRFPSEDKEGEVAS